MGGGGRQKQVHRRKTEGPRGVGRAYAEQQRTDDLSGKFFSQMKKSFLGERRAQLCLGKNRLKWKRSSLSNFGDPPSAWEQREGQIFACSAEFSHRGKRAASCASRDEPAATSSSLLPTMQQYGVGHTAVAVVVAERRVHLLKKMLLLHKKQQPILGRQSVAIIIIIIIVERVSRPLRCVPPMEQFPHFLPLDTSYNPSILGLSPEHDASFAAFTKNKIT